MNCDVKICLYRKFLLFIISSKTLKANTVIEKGKHYFHFYQRVHLAEKFINVRFIVPNPAIVIRVRDNLTTLETAFNESSSTHTELCQNLAFPNFHNLDVTEHLNFLWLLNNFEEHLNALENLTPIRYDKKNDVALHYFLQRKSRIFLIWRGEN